MERLFQDGNLIRVRECRYSEWANDSTPPELRTVSFEVYEKDSEDWFALSFGLETLFLVIDFRVMNERGSWLGDSFTPTDRLSRWAESDYIVLVGDTLLKIDSIWADSYMEKIG
jgi:hypothetical protein